MGDERDVQLLHLVALFMGMPGTCLDSYIRLSSICLGQQLGLHTLDVGRRAGVPALCYGDPADLPCLVLCPSSVVSGLDVYGQTGAVLLVRGA